MSQNDIPHDIDPDDYTENATQYQEAVLGKMIGWAEENGIEWVGFNDDGTVDDVDGETHQSPYTVPDRHEQRILNVCRDCDFIHAEAVKSTRDDPTTDPDVATAAQLHYHETGHDTFAGVPEPRSEWADAWEIVAYHDDWGELEDSLYYYSLVMEDDA